MELGVEKFNSYAVRRILRQPNQAKFNFLRRANKKAKTRQLRRIKIALLKFLPTRFHPNLISKKGLLYLSSPNLANF